MDDEHGGGIYPKDTATWEAATIISRSRTYRDSAHGAWTSPGPESVLGLLVEKRAIRDTTYVHACTICTKIASLPALSIELYEWLSGATQTDSHFHFEDTSQTRFAFETFPAGLDRWQRASCDRRLLHLQSCGPSD